MLVVRWRRVHVLQRRPIHRDDVVILFPAQIEIDAVRSVTHTVTSNSKGWTVSPKSNARTKRLASPGRLRHRQAAPSPYDKSSRVTPGSINPARSAARATGHLRASWHLPCLMSVSVTLIVCFMATNLLRPHSSSSRVPHPSAPSWPCPASLTDAG